MCLAVKHNTKIHTAKRDIVVYKRMNKDFFGVLRSPLMNMIYSLGRTVSVPFFSDQNHESVIDEIPKGVTEINAGLHSYRTAEIAARHWSYHVTVECIIPKGTQYIANKTQIVALSLIPVKVLGPYA